MLVTSLELALNMAQVPDLNMVQSSLYSAQNQLNQLRALELLGKTVPNHLIEV
jgi:hypothetical protein